MRQVPDEYAFCIVLAFLIFQRSFQLVAAVVAFYIRRTDNDYETNNPRKEKVLKIIEYDSLKGNGSMNLAK